MSEKILKVTFEANEQDIEKFNKLLKEAGINAKELEDQMGKTGESTEGLSETFKTVSTAVKAFIAAAAVKEIINIGVAASKAAAEVEGMESAFRNLGGTAMDLEKLSKAVGGTQSKVTLMKLSVQALQKGVGFKDLEKAMGFVAKQADATNQSFEGLADTLIDSIGKQSAKGLQALGINTKLVEENGKKIGFMPALLEEIGKESAKLGSINTETADGYTKLGLAQEELQLSLGKFLNSKAATGFLNYWADVATNIVKATDEFLNGENLGLKTMDELLARQKELKGFWESNEKLRKAAPQGIAGSGIRDKTAKTFMELSAEQEAIKAEIFHREEAERIKEKNRLQAIEDAANVKRLQSEEEAAKAKAAADAKAKAEAEARELAHQQKLEGIRRKLAQDQAKFLEQVSGQFDTGKLFDDFVKESELFTDKVEAKLPTKLDKPQQFQDADKRAAAEAERLSKANKKSADDAQKIADGFQLAEQAAQGLVNAVNVLGNEDASGASKIGAVIGALSPLLAAINPALGAAAGAVGGILQQFNEGGWVGGHGPDKDTVPALLTTGEHVTRRKHAQRSPLLLDAINSGELDDRIFTKLNLLPSINIDQDKVVEAIQSIPVTDLYKSGSALFEHRSQVGKRNAGRHKRISL